MKEKILLLLLSLAASFLLKAQSGVLQGHVTTDEGLPVAAATVQLVNTKWSTITDENGFYRFRDLPPAGYEVQISFSGENRDKRNVQVDAGKESILDFVISQPARQLNEVIVETGKIMNRAAATANKLPLSSLETPQIVHSISGVVLRKQNATTLEDAMKNAPGVTKLWDATSRPDGGSFFVSRGFQTTTKARNGLPNIVNTNVDMANIERIEVIKGPSATLFGSIISSYGGLINRVTKKPGFYNGGYADVSYGGYNFYRASVDFNHVLQKDKLAMRLNVGGQNQDSWQDAGFQQTYLIAPSFLYKPNRRFTLHLDGEIVGSKGNSNGGNFMFILTPGTINGSLSGFLLQQGLPPTTVAAIMSQAPKTIKQAFGTDRVDELRTSYDRSFISNDVYAKTQSNAVFADASYLLSRNWTSQTVITYANSKNNGYTSYQYLLPNYLNSFVTSMMSGGGPDFGTPGHDSLGRMVWNPVGRTNTFNIQQNFISDYTFGKVRTQTIVGLDYANYKSHVNYNRFYGNLFNVVPFPDLFDVVDVDGASSHMPDFNKPNVEEAYRNRTPGSLVYDQESEIFGAYANNVTHITSYLIASAGVRVDHFRNRVLDKGQTKWSPKFGLVVMPLADRLTIFANYQNSFTNKFGADKNNNAFVPEEANQKEVGVKYTLLNNRLTGSVSYYHILAKNVIRTDMSDPQFNIQDGEQRSRGIEAEIVANPVSGWTVLAGYGYNDSKYVKADSDVEGLRPVGTGPLNSANFWTNYTFTRTVLKGFGVGLSINYAGDAYAVNNHNDGKLILPSYTVLGAHLTYDARRYRLGLKLNNITNEKYWMGWTNYIPQMPRQLTGTITVKF